MDPVHSTYRSFAGGRSIKLVTTKPYHPSNDMFINPARHYLDAASPRQRPYPSPRKSRKHGAISSSLSSSAGGSSSWWSNPEMKRKRRVVKYKLYAAEGKMKSSIKNGFRWIKRKCKKIVFGINY